MHQFLFQAVPRPQFHQRMQPQVDVPRGDVRPQVSHLLLTAPPDFLHIVEHLLDRRPVGEHFDNLCHRGIHIRAEEKLRARLLLHDDHPDRSSERAVRRQERLELFGHLFPVDRAGRFLPAVAMSGPFRQGEAMLSVDAFASPTFLRLDRRQIEQGGVLVPSIAVPPIAGRSKNPGSRG